jgi:hypothetical protein
MKSFVEYLTESKKTYDFKIGVAGDLAEGFADTLETCLQKYSLANISAGKKTPIQERPLDFPQLENVEVTYWDVEVNYPTTVQMMEEYLSHTCGVSPAYVIVRDPAAPQEEYQEKKDEGPYEPMLGKDDMGGESAQESVAGNRVMDLLKELETARKERENDPLQGTPAGESQDIAETENTTSVVGS